MYGYRLQEYSSQNVNVLLWQQVKPRTESRPLLKAPTADPTYSGFLITSIYQMKIIIKPSLQDCCMAECSQNRTVIVLQYLYKVLLESVNLPFLHNKVNAIGSEAVCSKIQKAFQCKKTEPWNSLIHIQCILIYLYQWP